MSKKLLEESTIRQFMKLASLEPLSENFIDEGKYSGEKKMKEEAVEETAEVMEEEATLEEMRDPMMEEEDEVEMEAEEGDMEAEINITPDQARAIIAVAEMLKDIMPDLDAPEMEAEEEEMDMEEPEMEAEEEEEIETPEGDEEVEAEEEEELTESILKRVQARLKELKDN